jgi:hypothetical protein
MPGAKLEQSLRTSFAIAMPDSRTAKIPNFLLAGAGESGTTSLYRYLKQHPQVYMSPIKEPNFFAAADIMSLPNFKPMEEGRLSALLAEIERQERPPGLISIAVTKWEDYLRLFQNVRDEVAIGEASVMNLWFPSAAPAIHRTLPRAKLIFLLRDPTERLYTLYLRTLHTGHRTTFRDWVLQAMQTKPDRRQGMQRHPVPLDCGLYAIHLQRFFDMFPREQIRIYLYEAYRADAQAVLRDIFGFLGVDADHPIDTSQRHHETTVPRFPVLHRLRRRLVGDTPLTGWMPTPVRRALRGFYFRLKGRGAMDPADRRMVIDYYRDEILRAQDLIGQDLSAWLR